nr:MAG TPA: hypothetical protein [Caudoviricetes sp.]
MKVKGTEHIERSVEVELDAREVGELIDRTAEEVLLHSIQGRAMQRFYKRVAGFEGAFTVRHRQGEDGATIYQLWEIDADWDYHNNAGIDEKIKDLTAEEVVEYNYLSDWVKNVIFQLKIPVGEAK